MRSVAIAPLALLALLLCGPPSPAAEEGAGTLRVPLAAQELPVSWIKDLDASQPLIPADGGAAPEGFHSPTLVKVGASLGEKGYVGGTPALFLLQGDSFEAMRLFFRPEGGEPVEIPRWEKSPFPQNHSFGPFRMEGRGPMSLHLMVPARTDFAKWRGARKYFRALPMECRAGDLVLEGKKTRIALLDRDLNGKSPDFCARHAREGDSLLVDADGDGAFTVSRNSPECRGLTRFLVLGGRTYGVALKGGDLVLEPKALPLMWVRFPNLAEGCVVSGWSHATGAFQETLDADRSLAVPREKAVIYTYRWVRDGWTLSGSLFNVGAVAPPDGTGPLDLAFGPPLKAEFKKVETADGVKFTFKSLGSGKESALAAKGSERNLPVLVVADAEGREVFRQSMNPG
ncbi:MAG: hypothetical protein MUC63_01760 [Planctomycetes bacterium]|nr:hypothetical protein [Planctomycetota bacterium]